MKIDQERLFFDDQKIISTNYIRPVNIHGFNLPNPDAIHIDHLSGEKILYHLSEGILELTVTSLPFGAIFKDDKSSAFSAKVQVQKLQTRFIPVSPCKLDLFSGVFDFMFTRSRYGKSGLLRIFSAKNVDRKDAG